VKFKILFACRKRSGHVDANSGLRQLNCEAQISLRQEEFPCFPLRAHSTVEPTGYKDTKNVDIFFKLTLYLNRYITSINTAGLIGYRNI
jgi:hypothetical protein